MLQQNLIIHSYTSDTAAQAKKAVNVSAVPQRSPFRYPGGKTWLVPEIRRWLAGSRRPDLFIEPFAGGGIISLTVAAENLADRVLMVELDPQVASVWHTLINDDDGAEWLADRIMKFELTIENTEAILLEEPKNTREFAFATILRNRVCHGGILARGSGLLKHGENGKGIASRWYPETLGRRIRNISALREKIQFIEGDALTVMSEHTSNPSAYFFIDPPYTAGVGKRAGRRLYAFSELNHDRLFDLTAQTQTEIMMTYDDANDIEQMAFARGFRVTRVPMRGTHNIEKMELVITKSFSNYLLK